MGFAQVLPQIHTEWILLLACDLPYLHPLVLQDWMQQLPQAGSAIAVLPQGEKGWEPLCGFYRTQCLPSLQAFIRDGGRSFQAWLSQERVHTLHFSPDADQAQRQHRMLFNCNTPAELAALYELDPPLSEDRSTD
jgi:molybdopterin-guanine dinucleotide biosynthesis protein A